MKNLSLAFFLFVSCSSVWANSLQPFFDLQRMPLSQVVSLYFKEVSLQPYVLCDALLNDQRLVSVRASGKDLDAAILRGLLDLNGYALQKRGSVVVVQRKIDTTELKKESLKYPFFVYRPKFRDVKSLVSLAAPVVQGTFASQSVSPPALAVGGDSSSSVAPSYASRSDEVLVFSGAPSQVNRLRDLLRQVDVSEPSVLVRAALFEVSKSSNKSSALKVVSDILKVSSVASGVNGVLSNSLSIKRGSFETVASAISSDDRFKVITSPFVRVKNREAVRLQVGQDVPVAGKILINPNGQTTQSTEYHSSGVILNVLANIRGDSVDLELTQTVSNFIKTTTGNTDNPTMNKREIQTVISLADKEIVMLGGLLDHKEEKGGSGLLGFNFARASSEEGRELLLLLQVEKV